MNKIIDKLVLIEYIDGYQLEVKLLSSTEFKILIESGLLELNINLTNRFCAQVFNLDDKLVIETENYGRVAEVFNCLDDLILFKRSGVIAISRKNKEIYSYVHYQDLKQITSLIKDYFELIENYFKDSLIKLYKMKNKENYFVIYLNPNLEILGGKYFTDLATLNAIQPQNYIDV